MFRKFFSFFPIVKAQEEEEEMVDPHTVIREKCGTKPNIESLFTKYQECNDRVSAKSRSTETCVEELFDYIHELDHCVSKTLWPKLK